MQTLHIELKSKSDSFVEFRYYWDNPNDFRKRTLELSEITDLLKAAELDYYTPLPEDFAKTGRKLFNWLDGSDRHLAQMLEPFQCYEGLIIAISTAGKLAHLPWELLHDGLVFLVERSLIPVRWFPKTSQGKVEPANRPLRVLFMAASPLGVEPVLNFEAEEAMILDATKEQPLQLEVEESGCLTGLGNVVKSNKLGYFDVLHLTGHAVIKDGQPRFLTEKETGERHYASAEDIAQALAFRFRTPRLVFLSGCRTGQAAKAGDVPSMAEALLQQGATAVLGWGRTVLDTHATQTAAVLYGELTAGMSVSEALALTYQALLKKPKEKEQARNDWHLLRLYIAGEVPGALVTPRDEPDRELSIVEEAAEEFLDPDTKEVKVTGRQGFVGRRRPLQNCLRALSISSKQVGVMIYGMGGLGKSTLAARICDRLSSRFERLVLVGKIDEPELVKLLNEKLENQVFRDQLLSQTEELKFRLRSALKNLFQKDKKKLLLVLDDFEQNLEQREHGFVLSSDAAKVLTALVWALRESGLIHRLIITCRYDFDFSGLQHFYKQPLAALSPVDIQKKCRCLESFQTNSKITLDLQKQALEIADGNPRLLEWLNKTLQDSAVNHAEILTSLAKNPVELREQVLAQELLNCIGEPMQQMLQLGRIFEIPVPRAAIEEICIDISDLSTHINRAIALGLLELSADETVKVPRILPLKLEHSELLYNQAARCLYCLWGEIESQSRTEQQLLEIYRLALLGKSEDTAALICAILSIVYNSTSRFREVISLCQSTLSIICNEQYKMTILSNQGGAYNSLGLYQEAMNSYQESKSIAEALSDINFDRGVTGNLGNYYYNIGKIEQAIDCYTQALEIASTSGDEDLQGIWHSNLGNTYSLLGKISLAVDNYEKALAICTKNKNRQSEACCCCNLCDCYGLLGNSELAINYAKQALTILEEIPDLDVKATTLHSLAEILIDEERYDEAMLCANEGIEIAKLIDSSKVYSENYSALACAYLYSNTNDDKLSNAWEAAENANNCDVPQNNYYVLLLLGLIALKQRNPEVATEKFTDALENAEKFISENQYAYRAWYIKWLALSGLTLSADVENQKYALEAEIAYQQARYINKCDGVLKRVKHLFKIITSVDVEKCLDNLQKIVQGE